MTLNRNGSFYTQQTRNCKGGEKREKMAMTMAIEKASNRKAFYP
jgi:hypothetical protein